MDRVVSGSMWSLGHEWCSTISRYWWFFEEWFHQTHLSDLPILKCCLFLQVIVSLFFRLVKIHIFPDVEAFSSWSWSTFLHVFGGYGMESDVPRPQMFNDECRGLLSASGTPTESNVEKLWEVWNRPSEERRCSRWSLIRKECWIFPSVR